MEAVHQRIRRYPYNYGFKHTVIFDAYKKRPSKRVVYKLDGDYFKDRHRVYSLFNTNGIVELYCNAQMPPRSWNVPDWLYTEYTNKSSFNFA